MKSRLVMFLAVALAAAAVGVAVGRLAASAPSHPPAAHATLPPELAAYLGAFEPGSPPNYGAIASFGQVARRQPNLLGYYSGWAQPFDTSFAETLHKHGVIPFVQIDPTDASIAAIAAGTYDDYLRSYADSVRDFRHAVVIGFGHEMNASWYSWGYKHVPAPTFVAAWRHIVTLFRNEGADNVTWLWTLQADQPGTGPIASWWPGAQYVTWVGIDGYYYRSIRHLRQRLRPDHQPGAGLHRQAGAAVRDRGRARRRPVRQDPGPVPRDGHVQDARAGVVRQDPARQHLPPGLEDRRQPAWPRFPSGWAYADELTPYRPAS